MLKFAPELFRYKGRIAVVILAAIAEALFSVGGFGVLMKVIEVFLGEERKNLRQIIEEMVNHDRVQNLPFINLSSLSELSKHVTEDPFKGFAILLVFVFIMVIFGSIARFIHQYLSITVCWRAVMRIRARLFHHLIGLSMTTLDEERLGDKISRILIDCSGLSRGYQAILGRALRDALQGIVFFGIAMAVSWKLTLLFLISAPIVAVVLAVFGKRIRKASRRTMKYVGVLLGSMTESLQALPVVKVHQTEGYERRRFNRANRKLYKTETRARIAKAMGPPITDVVAIAGVVGVALIAAHWIFNVGSVRSEQLVMVLVALGASAASFKQLAKLNNDFQEAGAAADRILEALDLEVEPSRINEHEKQLPRLPRHQDDIVFQNVSFQYPSAAEDTLKGINLQVKHGEVVAVVGPNGSGKSTLLNLLPRLYDVKSGRILIDGHDVSDVSISTLRKQIAVVTQRTVLFEGSIGDNIKYGSRHVSYEQMKQAAEQSFADEFIQELPDKYATKLGEQGSRLSGGQQQRIAIARAILRNPTILILDEATSQVDADSESRINQALKYFIKDRTTFVIAHRLSTVIDADKIVVMNQGQIESIGKHHELLLSSEVYQMLCQTQLQGGDV